MLIVRPGTPPHICTARIAQAAQRAAHCRGALHSGGASFPYPVPDPATTAQRPAPITTPGTLRPAPSQRPATTSDIITTPGTTYARPTATTTITPTVTSSVTSTVTSSVATTRHPPYYNRRQPPVCCCRIAQVAPRAHLSRQQHHHQRPLPPNRQFHRRVRCFSAPPTRALRPLFAWLPRLHPRSFLGSTCSAPTPEFLNATVHFLRISTIFFTTTMDTTIYDTYSSFRTSESAADFRQPLTLTRHSAAGEL